MARYLARRLLLALVTLWLLVTIVFVISNVLPRDVGRTILGPFAPQESVDALNERLGTNRPLDRPLRRCRQGRRHPRLRQLVRLGSGRPAAGPRRSRSIGQARRARPRSSRSRSASPRGCMPARRRDRKADRAIVLLGVTSSSIPEFITGTILVVVVGRPAGLAAGPRDATAERRHPDPDPLPADARDSRWRSSTSATSPA